VKRRNQERENRIIVKIDEKDFFEMEIFLMILTGLPPKKFFVRNCIASLRERIL
jgi:hypothetical protein